MSQFPLATQAQLIRANQRDLMGVAQLRDMSESVLRSWLGTRWLAKWEKELQTLVQLGYHSLLASQTLGEEYVDIWQVLASSGRPPSGTLHIALFALQAFPPYVLSRCASRLARHNQQEFSAPATALLWIAQHLSTVLEIMTEVNLAIFYFSGKYYSLAKRVTGILHISSLSQDPNSRPPSYSLLGVLLGIRLAHRLITAARALSRSHLASQTGAAVRSTGSRPRLDSRPIDTITAPATEEIKDAEQDHFTIMNFSAIPTSERSGRRCTLCLEERTESCATECGHLFCWTCVVSWGREKPQCPLCRQTVDLSRLLPLHNI